MDIWINVVVGFLIALFYSACSWLFIFAAWTFVGSGSTLVQLSFAILLLNFAFYEWIGNTIKDKCVHYSEVLLNAGLEEFVAPHFAFIILFTMAYLVASALPDGMREIVAVNLLWIGIGILSLKAISIGTYFGILTALQITRFRAEFGSQASTT